MLTKNHKPVNLKRLNKIIISLIIVLGPTIAFGQLGIDYNQSNLPFVGLSYELKDRFRPEIRFGTDNYFEDISLEGILTYDIINNDNYEFYGGLGFRTQVFNGLVIPIGFNFYPLTTKEFGFQIELAPIIGE
ncbi:MAG: hypothetical protein QW818_03820, partial [Candidatus Aenigmatarchaeota archaeon]